MVQGLARGPLKALGCVADTRLARIINDLHCDGVGWSRMETDSVNAIYNAICPCSLGFYGFRGVSR
jgi:hypothetical protein